ncbi:potassium channel, subfamily K, member 16-like [Parasteatoda tepidariorum]|uniref:potassium channel, subfamily K, member 16-like n=1 Tax=Parasteatoda tepidariorum TaxID=114398 RepID=UPI0039BD470C
MKKMLLASNYTEAEIKKAISEFYPKSAFVFASLPLFEVNIWWTFFNTFFFCYNMVATIGYTGYTPFSITSQMFCSVYVLFGIPLAMLFNKVLGQYYAESQNEMVYLLRDKVPYSKYFSNCIFFASWSFLYYFVPTFVFLYTEDWNFFNGLYFSTTVAAACGMGDFFVGQNLKRNTYFVVYRLLLLSWLLHAIAFFIYTAELLSKVFSRYLLFELVVDMKENVFEFHRVFVHPECLDIHFRLLRAEMGVKKEIDIWRADKALSSEADYLKMQLNSLVLAADDLDIVTVNEMRKKGYSLKTEASDEFTLE